MLEQIIVTKRNEVRTLTLPPMCDVPRVSLAKALTNRRRAIGLIAEVKKASPSKGVIRADFQPIAHANAYEQAGADAISVLTDETYFQGHRQYLTEIKQAVGVPVLRKDFIIDRVQIEESVRIGADAILLIGEALSPNALYELYEEAYEKGLECLVEVHRRETLENILALFTPAIIGINNRNLRTFTTSLDTTKEVAPLVPTTSILVSESGIHTYQDMQTVHAYGAQAVLVGESLMRQHDVAQAVRALYGEVESVEHSS